MNNFVMNNFSNKVNRPSGRLPEYLYFLLWLILFNMFVFVSFVAIDNGYLTKVLEADRSRISLLIALVFFATSLYAGVCILRSGKYLKRVEALISSEPQVPIKTINETDFDDMIDQFIHEMATVKSYQVKSYQVKSPHSDNAEPNPGNLHLNQGSGSGIDKSSYIFEIYVDQLRAPSEVLTFVIDVLIRLGLIGTIIGFILMLQSFVTGPSPSAENIQELLITMSTGMGTALYTTFAGLVASTLLGLQQLLLNRNVERVVAGLIRISDIAIPTKANDEQYSASFVTG